VLLLHGASFTARTWSEIGLLGALEGAHRVCAADLPGFGGSEASAAAPLAWMEALVEALGLSRPVVVSPSMSGRYSLPWVTSASGRVAGFVAVAPVGLPSWRGALPALKAPVLAIWGERDRTIPLSHADFLVKESGGRADLVIIPGGSHAPYMSDPEAFTRALTRFLGRVYGAQSKE
jgi:abhydrolase domain-containing protein 14